MTFTTRMDRRSFLVSTAAVGGGLALGLRLPFGPEVVRAADGAPEVNAWVVIRPDDTVVIRIARSEMGQGTLTGLAQLVAEELECDWAKVTTEYPTPGESVARKRVWGDFSTDGREGRGEILRALLALSGRLEQAGARGETRTLTEMLLAREDILVRLERGDAAREPTGTDSLQRDVARELQRNDTEVLRHLEPLRRGVVARSMQDQVPPLRRRGGSRLKSSAT